MEGINNNAEKTGVNDTIQPSPHSQLPYLSGYFFLGFCGQPAPTSDCHIL